MDWQLIIDLMAKKGLAKNTQSCALTVIRLINQHAMLLGIIDVDKSAAVETGISNRKIYHVALENWEIERVLSAAKFGDEMAMLTAILCFTGFRINELLLVTRDLYDPEHRYIIGGSKTKAGKNRIVPVPKIIYPFVEHFASKNVGQYIFTLQSDGRKESYANVRRYLSRMCERIGIKQHTLHDCRRTMATLMKGIKAPEADKSAIIGHATVEMTRYYQDSRAEELLSIVDELWA
jgi:integrase